MLVLLSPAKTLDESPVSLPVKPSPPVFADKALELAGILKTYRPEDLADLMGISEKLAKLNAERYRHFAATYSEENSKAALFLFKGDVYAQICSLRMNACGFSRVYTGC